MDSKLCTSEVDPATAETLAARAAARGLSVGELVAELTARDDPDQIAELDRRWTVAQAEGTIAHADVVRWLETWGTSGFEQWRRR
jgi:hypothetical protein